MKTNDSSQENQGFNANTSSGFAGEGKKGSFQDAYRQLGSSVPLNRHNTADRQAVFAKVANQTFNRLSEAGSDVINVRAENYGSGEFEGIFPVTTFIHDTRENGSKSQNRGLFVYYVAHEIAGVNLDSRRLGNNTFGSNTLEIPNTIADVINDKSYKSNLVSAIARRKQISPDQITLVQGFYIPKEQSLVHAEVEGHEDAQRVQQYLHQIYNCLYTLLAASSGNLPELNLTQLTQNILIRHEVSELPGSDIAGNPYRSDIVSRLSISSSNQKESFAVTQENINLVQAHAYVDAAIPNSEPNISRNGETPRQAAMPHVIITKITSDQYHDHRILVLGLLAAFGVGDRVTRPWIGPLRLQPTGRGINTRDLGAFGLDRRTQLVNPPAFVSTQNGNLGDEDLRRLLSAVFVDNEIVFSIDVEELSDDAWLMQTLQEAATNAADAKAICDWVDELTGGIFYQIYNLSRDGGVLDSWNMRLPSGYHIDADGVKRDTVRTYDYLGIMNSVVAPNENKYDGSQVGLAISNIFTNETMSEIDRYVEWRNLVLPNVPNFVQTGWFRRYKFNSKFVNALIESVIRSLAQGGGRAQLINQPPAHGLEQRASYQSGMLHDTFKATNFNNGNNSGYGGGMGGNASFTNNRSFFHR